jgi:hypothetical protein
MNKIVACLLDDQNYVYGVGEGFGAETPEHWGSLYFSHEPFTLVELRNVPIAILTRLKTQGTGAQYYRDGYEAYDAMKPFIVGKILDYGF